MTLTQTLKNGIGKGILIGGATLGALGVGGCEPVESRYTSIQGTAIDEIYMPGSGGFHSKDSRYSFSIKTGDKLISIQVEDESLNRFTCINKENINVLIQPGIKVKINKIKLDKTIKNSYIVNPSQIKIIKIQ